MEVGALHRPSAPSFHVWMVVVAEMLFLVIVMALVNGVAALAFQRFYLSARLFSVFVVSFLTTIGVQVLAW